MTKKTFFYGLKNSKNTWKNHVKRRGEKAGEIRKKIPLLFPGAFQIDSNILSEFSKRGSQVPFLIFNILESCSGQLISDRKLLKPGNLG